MKAHKAYSQLTHIEQTVKMMNSGGYFLKKDQVSKTIEYIYQLQNHFLSEMTQESKEKMYGGW